MADRKLRILVAKPSPETRQALAAAVESFGTLDLALDAPLADTQAVMRNGHRIPISGSTFAYHMARSMGAPESPEVTEIRSGDSYMHLVTLQPGKVGGRFILTYSQSTNPQSPHYSDMTEVFSRQALIDIAFSDEQIAAAQVGETVVLDGRSRSAGRGRT